MKNVATLIVAVMVMFTSHAQLALLNKSANPGFGKAVEYVLGDFPYNYKHITGDLLLSEGYWSQFQSTVLLPGAESCTISHYHSGLDTTASWQALMYRAPDFKEAAKEYRRLFHQLKGCRLRMVDGSAYFLDGQLDPPGEDADFIISMLKLQTADERFREFKVELELQYKMDFQEWVISINMVSRKKDEDMRPDWMD
ncbi:MAG: hypothetical protein P0Y53_14745 [Candidatus Pseudobacter hemicellulosilyticus]|uniref:Uncharacterized protein n=1 Tax=Candidatus Pseudobacter hemicellulosilyticus TaxID=3121375 RepID=A0AAJ5WNA8_9BACT|nr:MAG: hypothetical protein P0Y53_14745 [Pseudobacter sp.]